MPSRLVRFLIAVLVLTAAATVYANGLTSPVSLQIRMKSAYQPGEAVTGKIILTNASAVNLPVTFEVKIFLDDQPQSSVLTNISSVLPGSTNYSLADFGIHVPPQPGHWRLIIKQENLSSAYAAVADFTIGGNSALSALRAVPVPLPVPAGPINFDDVKFSSLGQVLVPGGSTGKLFLANPITHDISSIGGLALVSNMQPGKGGITSADAGEGYIFSANRTSLTIDILHFQNSQVLGAVTLSDRPDYVRYIPAVHQLWVTEPASRRIQIFDFRLDQVTLMPLDSIALDGRPESLAIDSEGSKAYTNVGDKIVVIDVANRNVEQSWSNSCEASRGLALDSQRQWLFVGCKEGKVVMLDASDGHHIDEQQAGSGVDAIAYDPDTEDLFVPASKGATLSIFKVSSQGLSLTATVPIAEGSHCVAVDNLGQAWVCDPKHGQLLLIRSSR